MKPLPHTYTASSTANPTDNLVTTSDDLTPITVNAPADFDGPGDQWSPETLLMASVANCFILTFRAVATAMKLEWSDIECTANGLLDKVDRAIQFTEIVTSVKLYVPAGADIDKAEKVIAKAHSACLISNSLSSEAKITFEIHTR